MPEASGTDHAHGAVDSGRLEPNKEFDRESGFTGQAYSRDREAREGAAQASGHPLTGDPVHPDPVDAGSEHRDIPPENGQRASFDPKTGEVHGSGSGAGEDFDEGTSGGADGAD